MRLDISMCNFELMDEEKSSKDLVADDFDVKSG